MTEFQTLEHVNVPPAQTWNYLHTNVIAMKVPAPDQVRAEYMEQTSPAVTCFAACPASIDAVEQLPEELLAIETGVGDDANEWIAASATETTLVNVPAGTNLERPIVVDLSGDGVAVAHTGVSIGKGARATIVVIASASHKVETVSASLLRVLIEEDAHADIFELVAMGNPKQHIEGVGIECRKDASVNIQQYALSAQTSAVGLAANLVGDRSSLTLSLHYLVGSQQTLDCNHIVRQRGRNTRCVIDESGVLSDKATKTLKATIDLIRGCKGSKGREQETVVLAGDDVVNKTLPVILCDEEEVQGDHGATIGSMSAEQLQYLRNRGLTEEQAEDLFRHAVADGAVIHAPTPKARKVALQAVAQIFGKDIAEDLAEIVQPSFGFDE